MAEPGIEPEVSRSVGMTLPQSQSVGQWIMLLRWIKTS